MSGAERRNRGSITVEAAILAPFIILSITASIFIGFIYYQRALLQSAADDAARAGAATWCNISSDIATGKTEIGELNDAGLYWRLFDIDKNEKVKKIESYCDRLINKRNILKPSNSNVCIEVKNYIVYKRLIVTVENKFPVPGGAALGIFGLNRSFNIKVSSSANINDPTEFIRTTDFILDMEKELEDKYKGLKDIGDKAREVFAKIKRNIDKLNGAD